jgi:hypothetical protein
MPASKSPDPRETEDAVRAAVVRLSRRDRDGGAVIERAAIMAEGTPAAAIEAWVVTHGGRPEAASASVRSTSGLSGLREQRTALGGQLPPRRYVFPAGTLAER